MSTPQREALRSTARPFRAPTGHLFSANPLLYNLIVLLVAVAVCVFSLKDGVFSCQAGGYSGDRYLAYCNATGYGDYDHGAFWYDLEPSARDAARMADVLLVGNSRLQLGFSSRATDNWFAAQSVRYFMLGFSHYVNLAFEAPLLQKIKPRASVYVINADRFFERSESQPAQTAMHDSVALNRYRQKRDWQPLHRAICATVRSLCGNEYAIYRSRTTGDWQVGGGQIKNVAVSYDGDGTDGRDLDALVEAGRTFLSQLPVNRDCVILALVPYVKTDAATARNVAERLNLTLVAPQPDGLNTFDGGHLDRRSAEVWSTAFFEAAGPRIQRCLTMGRSSRLPSGSGRGTAR